MNHYTFQCLCNNNFCLSLCFAVLFETVNSAIQNLKVMYAAPWCSIMSFFFFWPSSKSIDKFSAIDYHECIDILPKYCIHGIFIYFYVTVFKCPYTEIVCIKLNIFSNYFQIHIVCKFSQSFLMICPMKRAGNAQFTCRNLNKSATCMNV